MIEVHFPSWVDINKSCLWYSDNVPFDGQHPFCQERKREGRTIDSAKEKWLKKCITSHSPVNWTSLGNEVYGHWMDWMVSLWRRKRKSEKKKERMFIVSNAIYNKRQGWHKWGSLSKLVKRVNTKHKNNSEEGTSSGWPGITMKEERCVLYKSWDWSKGWIPSSLFPLLKEEEEKEREGNCLDQKRFQRKGWGSNKDKKPRGWTWNDICFLWAVRCPCDSFHDFVYRRWSRSKLWVKQWVVYAVSTKQGRWQQKGSGNTIHPPLKVNTEKKQRLKKANVSKNVTKAPFQS